MYDNIGEKLKGLAKIIFVIETIAMIITALVLMAILNAFVWGLLLLVCGPLFAWVSSWMLYAFGQLVDDVSIIRQQTRKVKSNTKSAVIPNSGNNSSSNINTNTVLCETCGAIVTSNQNVCHVCKSIIKKDTKDLSTELKSTDVGFCESCGADVSSDKLVCHVCGKKI